MTSNRLSPNRGMIRSLVPSEEPINRIPQFILESASAQVYTWPFMKLYTHVRVGLKRRALCETRRKLREIQPTNTLVERVLRPTTTLN